MYTPDAGFTETECWQVLYIDYKPLDGEFSQMCSYCGDTLQTTISKHWPKIYTLQSSKDYSSCKQDPT